MDRRQFTTLGAASLGSLLTQKLWAEQVRATASPDKFYFALVADTHIIDNFYVKGSENGVEDNESILVTTPRFTSARDLINSLNPAIEQVFLIGDYFHNYPSTDYDFYFKNTTRLDNAKAITDGFKMPVHLGFGNHDYDVHHVPREMSHRLFKAKFNAEPYSVVDYKGYKFIHLNNFLGSTQDRTASDFNPGIGSLGEEQLHWFEAQLQQRKPTFVFIHYPLDPGSGRPSSATTACIRFCANIRTTSNSSSPATPQVDRLRAYLWPAALRHGRHPLRPQRLHADGSGHKARHLAIHEREPRRVVHALQQALPRGLIRFNAVPSRDKAASLPKCIRGSFHVCYATSRSYYCCIVYRSCHQLLQCS